MPLPRLACRRPANWTLEASNKYACTSRIHAWGEICFFCSRGTCITDVVFFPQRSSSAANLLTFDTRAPHSSLATFHIWNRCLYGSLTHTECSSIVSPCFRLNFDSLSREVARKDYRARRSLPRRRNSSASANSASTLILAATS
jgi:hypothetical protein